MNAKTQKPHRNFVILPLQFGLIEQPVPDAPVCLKIGLRVYPGHSTFDLTGPCQIQSRANDPPFHRRDRVHEIVMVNQRRSSKFLKFVVRFPIFGLAFHEHLR